MGNYIIKAKAPKEFDQNIHKVITFKRQNYKSLYRLNDEGYYQSAEEGGSNYSEEALLSMNNFEVVDYIDRQQT